MRMTSERRSDYCYIQQPGLGRSWCNRDFATTIRPVSLWFVFPKVVPDRTRAEQVERLGPQVAGF
jgi:hypothetical protein